MTTKLAFIAGLGSTGSSAVCDFCEENEDVFVLVERAIKWLKENNIDATYDKIKLEVHEIKNFIQEIKEKKIAGCNVTVPFKKTVIPFLDRLSPEAEQTQSVNTITYDNGDLVGHNTDIAGFSTAIKKLNFNIKGKKVLILGAGGVVPSIIFALKKYKNEVKRKIQIIIYIIFFIFF